MEKELIERQKNDLIRDITSSGSLFFYILVTLFFLLSKNYEILTQVVIGFIMIYVVTIFIRSTFFKERPKKLSYNSFIAKLDASSLPSLHAARTAFLGAILIKFLDNIAFSILMIFLILIVSYSRIYLQKHDIKDISAGLILGIAVYFVVNFVL
jgi:membrane-associated phospholipid phosphatase|tara:strand:+ start:32994 stop:33455 length:462 start_codon:yes stop_codon:yes gene_type:complete